MKNSASGFWTKLVVGVARLYLRMPVKPFSKMLGRLYARYINSGNDRSIVTKRIDGINYELDLREVIDYAMYTSGSREPDTSHALKVLCKHGHVVLDIGANVGSHALPMASYVGEEGKVYAFEPVPWAMNRMKRNLELNNFNNLVLEPIALSDVNEEVEMKFRASFKIGSKSGVGAEGKIDDGWWDECEQVKVHMETLDSYVANHQISRINLIKLDVDGFEGKVLRGALETLKRFHPIIIMEVAPAWTEMRGDNMKDILRNIEQSGYKFYQEIDFEPIQNLSELIDALPPGGGFNMVASAHDLV
jgi:FkbM family methyltransferase